MDILLIYIIASAISSGILFYLMRTAPIGYEDEDGFHYGDRTFTSKEEAEEYAKSLVEGKDED